MLLLLVCTAALDLGTDQTALKRLAVNPAEQAGFLDRLSLNLSAPSAGGVMGMNLNRYCFRYFGSLGSSILFATLYLIGLYGLTNFHLGDWVRDYLERRRAARAVAPQDEKMLERRKRELEKEARRLQEKLADAELIEPAPVAQPSPPSPRVGLGPTSNRFPSPPCAT